MIEKQESHAHNEGLIGTYMHAFLGLDLKKMKQA